MKTRFFYGAETYDTWPKLFVLSEDGNFYCEYLDFMEPANVHLTYNFGTFKAEDYKWSGYQSIVEIDESTAKTKPLEKQMNWVVNYLNTLK